MKEPVHHHHLDIELHHGAEDVIGLHTTRRDPVAQLVHATPVDELEHQCPLTGVGVEHLRHADGRIVGEVPAHLLRISRFLPEVHFVAHALLELVEHSAQSGHVRRVETRGDEIEDATGRADVASHEPLHPGTQHLHHDVTSVHARAVHLSQRRRRQRLHVE